jgi:hypothetical protein
MTPTTTADADRRAWIGLAVLAVPCMLVTMDLTVLAPSSEIVSSRLQEPLDLAAAGNVGGEGHDDEVGRTRGPAQGGAD